MIHLITGNEPYRIHQYIKNVEESIAFKEINFLKFDEFNAIVPDMCIQVPVMSSKRVVVIETEKLPTGNDDLGEYIKNPVETTDLYIIVQTLDKRTSLYKELKKHKVYEFNKLQHNELINFIENYISSSGGSIEKDSISHFIDRVGYLENEEVTLYDVINSLDKVIVYDKSITKESIDRLIPKTLSDNVFKITQLIMQNNKKATFEYLNSLLTNEQNEIGLMSLILRNFRLLYKMSLYTEKGVSLNDIAKELGVSPFSLNWTKGINLSQSEVDKCIDLCNEKILRVKEGMYTGEMALQTLLVEIFYVIK